MNRTFDYSKRSDFIYVALSGIFKMDEFATMIRDMTELDYFHIGSRILFDDAELQLEKMTNDELMSASNTFIQNNDKLALSKVAILTTPETFNVARKFERITEFRSAAIIQIFEDKPEALTWLTGYATPSLIFET